MRKQIHLHVRLYRACLIILFLGLVNNSFSQFAPGSSSTSALPLTINGVYVGKGLYQTNATNTAVGVAALSSTTGVAPGAYNNTAVGYHALRLVQNGRVNVAIGSFALAGATGSNNTAVGSNALSAAGNSGEQNTALGVSASAANTTGMFNISVGQAALSANATGSQNVAIGVNALGTHTASIQNTAVGFQSCRLATGNSNTGLGSHTLWTLSTGASNTVVGTNSMRNNSSGSNNSIVGFNSFNVYATGNDNSVLGANALNVAGNFNVAIGSGATVVAGDNQLSIQNVFYGSNMNNAAQARMRIGGVPTTTVAGTLANGVSPKLRIDGLDLGLTNTGSIPSLQLQFVPTPANNATSPSGKYLFLDAGGIVCQAPLPPSGGTPTVSNDYDPLTGALTTTVSGVTGSAVTIANLYTANGTINASTTTSNNREVTMNGQNIWFKSVNSAAANGKIYIGWNNTTSPPMMPGTYRLYVEDGILTEKIKVAVRSSISWADYVFADNYKLMPLKSLESYIKANKHLPGIESADELAKNGLDLGAMQAKQMEKIEELTLYIIEQNKAIIEQNKALEKQDAEIETLKEQVKTLLENSKK